MIFSHLLRRKKCLLCGHDPRKEALEKALLVAYKIPSETAREWSEQLKRLLAIPRQRLLKDAMCSFRRNLVDGIGSHSREAAELAE